MNEMREERQRGNDDAERKKVKVHRDMIVCLVCCGFMDSEGSGGSSRSTRQRVHYILQTPKKMKSISDRAYRNCKIVLNCLKTKTGGS